MKLPIEQETRSVEETELLGHRFAPLLEAGDRVLISGELGAGKTAFARGVCRGLGVEAAVTSPTYTIARRYDGGRVPVSHLDLHRLAEQLAGEDPGLLEGELDPERVTLVEWPERAAAGWIGRAYVVGIEHLDEGSRLVRIR